MKRPLLIPLACGLTIAALVAIFAIRHSRLEKDLLRNAVVIAATARIGVSPDGKWVLQDTGVGDSPNHTPIAVATGGSRTLRWPYRDYYLGPGVWFPDSRHWAVFRVGNAGGTLLIFSLDSRLQRLPISLPPDTSNLIGFTPQGHALFTKDRPEVHSRNGADTQPIADVDISATPPLFARSASRSRMKQTVTGGKCLFLRRATGWRGRTSTRSQPALVPGYRSGRGTPTWAARRLLIFG